MELTAKTLTIIIFVIMVAFVLFLFFGSFASEAGAPASNIFYKLFDWISGFI
ncbi:MAG: hypothetical protein QXD48_01035 [Candidatus Aenigmatarchaeota archaeon]